MIVLISLLAAVSICVVVHVLSMAAAGWLVGAPLEKINLFYGPRIKQIKFDNVTFELHLIPFGGYVKFSDAFFHKVHPLKRIFIAICGCLALLLLSMIVFGTSEAFHKFIRGFSQIISGALSPRSVGAELLFAFYEFAKANSFVASLGVMASKMAAGNLLPLPVLNGGDIILMLLNWVKPMPQKVRERVQQFGFIILLILLACWLVALHFCLKRILT